MKRFVFALAFGWVLLWGTAQAKIDLVTLPERETVQLTIYNSADLTLVKESRMLTLKKGINQLQFSWENTLIDPTSLEMLPKTRPDEVEIFGLVFPPRAGNLGIFKIDSQTSGEVPVEITYLTSGLSWRAFYNATLSTDETSMRLQGYVRVANNSGEDYDNAQTRLIVGQIHLLDEIAVLARRQYPYGRPEPDEMLRYDAEAGIKARRLFEKAAPEVMAAAMEPKEITKEGLSEYFLYTIEGKESIPDQWSKRLPSFDVSQIPVENLYKFEEERFGQSAVRFLMFKNDSEHKLGITPIPDGQLKVFRSIDQSGHLGYEGQSHFKYIPVGEKAELDLGPVENVIVEPVMMKYQTQNHMFFENGNISGWDEIKNFDISVKNTREIPITVEIYRNFSSGTWDLKVIDDNHPFEKIDKDTVKFTLKLDGKSRRTFSYVLTTYHGTRSENR
ncbi:MAG: DUF4139 domain-containing protein [Desulfobacterales bacterium]